MQRVPRAPFHGVGRDAADVFHPGGRLVALGQVGSSPEIDLVDLPVRNNARAMVDAIAARIDLASDEIGIVCNQGPGPFTGIRNGLTVAKTLAWIYRKEIKAWPRLPAELLPPEPKEE